MHPIARYRKAKGWTQSALAAQLEVSLTSVQGWERGATPRPPMLVKLAGVLGVDALRLLSEMEAWQAARAEKVS